MKNSNKNNADSIMKERYGLKLIEKCHSLNHLHYIAKLSLIKKMKFHKLAKGDTFKLHNFPNIDFMMIIEGRMEVKWYNLSDIESMHEDNVIETLYVRDYLDEQRLEYLYPKQSIVEHTITCISEFCTIVTIDKHLY